MEPNPNAEPTRPEPMTMGTMPLNVRQRISEVSRACSYVRKDGVNLFHKYNYATAATIFEKVNEALYDNGLTSYTRNRIERYDTEKRTNARNVEITETLVTVECELHVVDILTGDEVVQRALGSGMDNSDKAVMKAQTAALKYAWMMLLNISTGDDPEADPQVDARAAGKPMPKEAPRGPYDPTRQPAPTVPPYGSEPEPEREPVDDERPAILQRPSETERRSFAEDLEAHKRAMAGEPAGAPDKETPELCKCGAPVIRKVSSKAKGSKPYYTCELSFNAFVGDEWSKGVVADLAAKGICGERDHVYRFAEKA